MHRLSFKHLSASLFHTEVLHPVFVVGPREQQLNLLGTVRLRALQNGERPLQLLMACIDCEFTFGPTESIERSGNLQDTSTNLQKFAVENFRRSQGNGHRGTR